MSACFKDIHRRHLTYPKNTLGKSIVDKNATRLNKPHGPPCCFFFTTPSTPLKIISQKPQEPPYL